LVRLDTPRVTDDHAPVVRLAFLFLVAGCVVEPGHTPVARISASPRAIPERDSFQTSVVLNGSASADPIDDPDGERPLTYRWEVTGDDARIVSGRTTAPTMTIQLFGAHPATVRLTVTDEDGQSSTARTQLQLTVAR
jgi:hypothetical protein